MKAVLPGCERHSLDAECFVLVGRLPENTRHPIGAFERLWQLHPADFSRVRMLGRLVPTPRWQQAYGRDYRFTGHINTALPVRPEMEPFLRWSQATIDARLNGPLLNWYEGSLHHCIGPHRDSSAGLSISNGASSLSPDPEALCTAVSIAATC